LEEVVVILVCFAKFDSLVSNEIGNLNRSGPSVLELSSILDLDEKSIPGYSIFGRYAILINIVYATVATLLWIQDVIVPIIIGTAGACALPCFYGVICETLSGEFHLQRSACNQRCHAS
jgi:hypothetical protein